MVNLKITLAIIAVFLGVLPTLSQSDTEDSDCWCKHESVSLNGGQVAIRNVDTLVVNGNPLNPFWRFVEECDDGEDCDQGTCKYEIKKCRTVNGVKICTWHEHEGECTIGEIGGGDIPWDTTGVAPGDCNCIAIQSSSDFAQVYLNIDILSSQSPDRFIIMEECDDSCSNQCQYLHMIQGVAHLKQGFCSEYWPGDTIVEPDTIISHPPKKSFSRNATEPVRLNVYPNPAQTEVHLIMSKLKDQLAEITVSDIQGRVVFELQTLDNNVGISLENWTSGIYVVSTKIGNSTLRKRLFIE